MKTLYKVIFRARRKTVSLEVGGSIRPARSLPVVRNVTPGFKSPLTDGTLNCTRHEWELRL